MGGTGLRNAPHVNMTLSVPPTSTCFRKGFGTGWISRIRDHRDHLWSTYHQDSALKIVDPTPPPPVWALGVVLQESVEFSSRGAEEGAQGNSELGSWWSFGAGLKHQLHRVGPSEETEGVLPAFEGPQARGLPVW